VEAISYLTGLSVLLIIGIIATIVARKLRVSSILFFILIGIFIANLPSTKGGVLDFPPDFLIAIALLTLAMIVFDGSSRLSLHELDKQSTRAVELVVAFIVMNALLVGGGAILLFIEPSVQGFLLAIIFAVIMAGTDPGSVFILLGETKHRVLEFLRLEAVLNTPVVVIIPFLLLDIVHGVRQLTVESTFNDLLLPLLQQVIVGIGTGLLIGVIVFRLMRKHYSKSLSPVVVIATTIFAYVTAEQLAGNGIVAVATLGLLFGNTYVKRKGRLVEFSSILSTSLNILVFLMVGMLVVIDFDLAFFIKSLALFVIAIIARFLAVVISLHGSEFKWREKLFMSLHMPKGIAVAVVTLTLAVLWPGLNELLTLMILFMVYSLILGSVTDRFSKYFIKKDILPEEAPVLPSTAPAKQATAKPSSSKPKKRAKK